MLQAALNYCQAEGYLTSAPKVRLPAKPAPRDRWLTRDEAARLLWAAYRNPKARHLARFILVALYTGTRSEAILRLRFMPHTAGGHVDTEAGRIYRRGAGQTETKKRQPPIPIPNKLRAHLRPMGAQRCPVRGRRRRAARRQRQNRVADGAHRGGHRALHAPRPSPHGDHVGDAARNRQVDSGRILRRDAGGARRNLRPPSPRLPSGRSRGDGPPSVILCHGTETTQIQGE